MSQVEPSQPTAALRHKRWIIFAVVVGLFLIGFYLASQYISLDSLVEQEWAIKQFYRSNPGWMILICFSVYLLVAGLSLPGALLLSLTMAWLLGFWVAFCVVSIASTTGATIAFLLSRFLFRETYQQRFSEYLKRFSAELDKNGALYLFTLRLTPAVPFFVINVVMGLTQIRTWTFWWVSWLGMMPWTAIFVNAGASIPDLATLQEKGVSGVVSGDYLIPLTVSLALIGLLPLAIRWLFGKRELPEPDGNSSLND